MSYKFAFQKLEIWQLSIDLASEIYNITSSFPSEERFGVTNQIRRAASSVGANIAEGSGRISPKDKARFIEIAYSSLMEVNHFLILAKRLGYLNEIESQQLSILELGNKINAFRKALLK